MTSAVKPTASRARRRSHLNAPARALAAKSALIAKRPSRVEAFGCLARGAHGGQVRPRALGRAQPIDSRQRFSPRLNDIGGPVTSPRRASLAATPEDDDAMRARLAALKSSLEARNGGTPAVDNSSVARAGYLAGMSAAWEFVGAIAAGALIGWGLDWLTGKKPWFLILFFVLGMIGGVANVIRVAGPKGQPKNPPKSPPIDRNSRLSGGQAPDKDGRRSASAAPAAPSGAYDDED
ncbi:MAG: hypothetical protein E7774_05245 [Bradyrhizobium sp.]|nr:MAG: hypothetical protein E7774_05245 [Bradyrhizobium sp.]